MSSAGLPKLAGAPPLGGEIMSHDFVEAALLRRAGWSVWLVPELGGSYEELPPTISDYAKRDRRWCLGNLQHVRLLAAKGLCPISRVHLAAGAFSYLASPMWLLLLLLTTFEALRAVYLEDPSDRSLFPAWPFAEHVDLLGLFCVAIAMLLLPKLMALALALGTPGAARRAGRRRRHDQERARGDRVLGAARADPDAEADGRRGRHPAGRLRDLGRAVARRRRRRAGASWSRCLRRGRP